MRRASFAARPRVYVPTSPAPIPSSATVIEADQVPSNVSVVDSRQIARTESLNITDALQQYVPSIGISEVTGNPFQPDVLYRGFVASPVAGTPQGLAVYQNGVRINEAFGDTVNWDLIPTAAIRSVTVVPNNPAFGLNALGGAINVQMKDGFNYHGAEINTMGGSFGRIQSSAQWGKQIDNNYAVYGALEGLHDNGFRNFSPSDIRRFYGDVAYKNDANEFHLNMGVADNKFGAAATVPVELLQQYWGATYTTPQTSANQVGYFNLTGKVEATPSWTIEGGAHLRVFSQKTVDGNPTGDAAMCADRTAAVFRRRHYASQWLERRPTRQSFRRRGVLGEIDRTTTRSTTAGMSLQATNDDQLFGHDNRFTVGGSFDSSVTRFTASAELGTIGPNYVVTGSGIFLGQSGEPVSIGPVALRTTNQYTGIYALDTFDVTKAFSITAGGRFNNAQIRLEDQIGTLAQRLSGVRPLQSDDRRHLQDHAGIDGLCRLCRGQPHADPAGIGLRRSGASLRRRGVSGFRSAVEAGRVPYGGGWPARYEGAEHRNARMEARRLPRHEQRRYPGHSQSGAAGIRLFPERRLDTPPRHRGRSHSEIEHTAALRQLCFRRCAVPRCPAGRLQQPIR